MSSRWKRPTPLGRLASKVELTAQKQKGPKSFLEKPFETPPIYKERKQMRMSLAPGETEPETAILVSAHKGFIEGERSRKEDAEERQGFRRRPRSA